MSNTLRVAKYRRHKPTGQAVVTLNGKDHYLGKWNRKASRAEYRRLVGEWLAGDGCLPASSDVTVSELALSYWRFAKSYYRTEPGKSRGAIERVRLALRPLREAYGHCLAREFGPLSLFKPYSNNSPRPARAAATSTSWCKRSSRFSSAL